MRNLFIVIVAMVLVTGCLKKDSETGKAAPLSTPAPPGEIPQSKTAPLVIDAKVLEPFVDKPLVDSINTDRNLSQTLWASEDRSPKKRMGGYRFKAAPKPSKIKQDTLNHDSLKAVQSPSLVNSFDAAGQATNITNTGNLFIPADSYGSVGTTHVMNVINTSIELYQKDGNGGFSGSLKNFFSPLNPVNATFDPKVIYDQFLNRWVVVTLERTDTSQGDPANTSRVLIAVSDDANPNGTWYMFALNTKLNISGTNYWFDYPGFALDEEVIYLTGNMFEFGQGGGVGSRLWIIEKSNFYAGNAPNVIGPYDPFAITGGINVTSQPAHVYGNTPASFGTYLVGYSGLTNGTDEFWQTIRIDNPLGALSFTLEYVNIGDVQADNNPLPEAPQFGSSTDTFSSYKVATNDSRSLNAVWRNNKLYSAATIKSHQQPGETSASWVSINANGLNAISYDQFGIVGGEQITNGAFTFFPAISVNSSGVVALGFSASGSNIFAGSYYTYRMPGDPANSMRTPQVLRHGQDFYHRSFGGNKNRWGDYSSMTVDPVNACFWVYNKYAIGRNYSTGSDDDGMFATTHGNICFNNHDLIFMNGFE